MDTEQIKLTAEVITALNEELEYQNSMAGTDRADERDNGLAGQLVTLGTYADRARDAWSGTKGDTQALGELRKVAAIACRALLRFGCPKRSATDEVSHGANETRTSDGE